MLVPGFEGRGLPPTGGGADASQRRRDARRRLRTILDSEATAILTSLALKPQTSGELADELAIESTVVRRQLRRLGRSGQVVRTGETKRNGRLENLYSIDWRGSVIPPEDLGGLSARVMDEANLSLLRLMFREAAEAIDAGTFGRRADRCLSRFPVSLDERGFREAIDLHRGLLLEVISEVEAAEPRLAASGEEPIAASAHILFCEFPTERRPGHPAEVESARRSTSGDRVERLAELIDPFRSRLLRALVVAPASAGSLATHLEVPVSKVRYELDRLLDDELVRVIRKKPSRGTVERVFVCESRRHMLSTGDLENHTGHGMGALGNWIVRTVFGEALETIRSGASRAVDDLVIVRVVMALDAEGFAAISARIEAVLGELFKLRDRCLEDLGEDEAPAHVALSGLFLFERAPAVRTAA